MDVLSPSISLTDRIWLRISETERSLFHPILPVRQNLHPMAHPTCIERQRVRRFLSGIETLSIRFPSQSWKRNFFVPSLLCSTCIGWIAEMKPTWLKSCRKYLERLVISSNEVAPFW